MSQSLLDRKIPVAILLIPLSEFGNVCSGDLRGNDQHGFA